MLSGVVLILIDATRSIILPLIEHVSVAHVLLGSTTKMLRAVRLKPILFNYIRLSKTLTDYEERDVHA